MFTSRRFSLLVIALTPSIALAAPRVSRVQAGNGSAIALEYSIREDVARRGERVQLEACLTNQNSESKRDVERGDSFAFEFSSGALASCSTVITNSPAGELVAADFACAVDGSIVRITRTGPTTPWPPGHSVCARVAYDAPTSMPLIATAMSVANVGAFRPPSPAAILVHVGDEFGSVGPTGPAGPAGPEGPSGATGPAAFGASVMAQSTGAVQVRQNEPPVVVPGLEVDITVAEGSKLDVMLDALGFACFDNTAHESRERPIIILEVDGNIVARRGGSDAGGGIANEPDTRDVLVLAWLSMPVSAGTHHVRALVDVEAPHPAADDYSRCVGTLDDDRQEARLIVKEIRSAP